MDKEYIPVYTILFYEYINTYNMDDSVREDNFKKQFKYYKSNKPKPLLCDVLSVDDQSNVDKVISVTANGTKENIRTKLLGLQSLKDWKLFSFQYHPGLLLIRNPFTSLGQRYWIRKCLEEYSRKPNKTNIDIEMCLQDWWAESYKNGQCNRLLQKKMRWTTLGYHHNWDTKVYTDDNKTPFPEELAELSDVVAEYLSYNNFKAEAAIVNYYHMDSTLSGHTDHSEVNLEAPLFSFSFGQSAIFLIGGKEKSLKPSAILLNSGDIVIMSKEARLCYHAVPKIVPATTTPWNSQEGHIINTSYAKNLKYISNPEKIISSMNKNADDTEWSVFNDFIKESRINMNVRQVLYAKQKYLTDSNFNDT